MEKILKPIATIAMLCAMVFIGGKWPENTPLKKVIAYDSAAFGIIAACGIYLKKTEGDDNGGLC